MALKIFLTNDGKAVSSVKVGELRRRPVRRIPTRSKWVGQRTLYMDECDDHDHPSIISVEAFQFNPEIIGGEPVGRRVVCVVCWKIILP